MDTCKKELVEDDERSHFSYGANLVATEKPLFYVLMESWLKMMST